ncbi:MAG: hypothetical protein SFV15_22385 [Polyangiaceae bacterium]|nr:hypothetical protein [Polyangiaceae bacterium]
MTELSVAFPWFESATERKRPGYVRAPRMAPSAVRIPHPTLLRFPLQFAAIGPQIFVHEGARQALERRLELAFDGPVQLGVTDNVRRMITQTREGGRLRVRLHMMFLGAPERVQEALARYIVFNDPEASSVVDAFIHANTHRIRASQPVSGPVRTQGTHHNLLKILAEVSRRYLGEPSPAVLITWGRRTQPRNGVRQAIKLGSYSPRERLIRVHPALDNAWVPRYFVAYVVYHELLHHHMGSTRSGKNVVLHGPEFRERESLFRDYTRAIAWEQKHIRRLLRTL